MNEDKEKQLLPKYSQFIYTKRMLTDAFLRLFMKGMETMTIQFGELFNHMVPAIESKKNEFHLYGYTTVTEEDIWTYCIRKKWRKKEVDSMKMHEIVNGILQISPAEFMTFTQIEEQRGSDWFSDLNSDELQTLLAPQKSKNKL